MKQINEELDNRRKKEKWRERFESKITADEAFWKTIEWIELAHKYFPKSCQIF